MARITFVDHTTDLNAANMNLLTQDEDLKPTASTFNGQDGRTITHNYGHTNYQIGINPKAAPQGFLGEAWYSKASNTVVIYNSGSARGAFDYVITPHA